MRRAKITVPAAFASLTLAAAGLAGCGGGQSPGSFDGGGGNDAPSLASQMSLDKLFKRSASDKPIEKLDCPEIVVLDGTAAHRVYQGPESNENVRYQYSLGDVARECIHQGDQIAMKVGIAGQVLLGPVGAPGSFTVPIRLAVVREADSTPVLTKLYSASVTIVPGKTEGNFTIVTEPLLVPFLQARTAEDYSIKVGIDVQGPGGAPAERPRKKKGA